MKAELLCALFLAALPARAPAQAADLARLESRIAAALARSSAWLVTVQTFGGTPAAALPASRPASGPTSRPGPASRPGPDAPGRPAPRGFPVALGATTGVVVDPQGLVLTSLWSFQLAPAAILVTFPDGRKLAARPLGRDFSRGLALLAVEASGVPVPEAAPPASRRPGASVRSLGRTFGPELPAASLGIVSAVGRLGGRALQTDADVAPSNYGGALVDLDGRLLGILVPLAPQGYAAGIQWYDSGIGFACEWPLPVRILEALKAGEDLFPGQLGVAPDPADLGPGALVARVSGAAERCGLKRGDRIVSLAGTPVRHSFHLQELAAALLAGESVALSVARGGETLALQATLEPRSTDAPPISPGLR